MEEPNPIIPFEFADCDAFLASLDENSSSSIAQKQQQSQDILRAQQLQFQQQQLQLRQAQQQPSHIQHPPPAQPIMIGQPSLNDFVSMSAEVTGDSVLTQDWSQQDSQQMYTDPYALSRQQQQLRQQQVQQQQQQRQQQQQSYSSNSTPLSSPLSVNSMPIQEQTNVGFIGGADMLYPASTIAMSNLTYATGPIASTTTATAASTGSFDGSAPSSTPAYPITPPYPSAPTGSSVGGGDADTSSPDMADYANTSAAGVAAPSYYPTQGLLPGGAAASSNDILPPSLIQQGPIIHQQQPTTILQPQPQLLSQHSPPQQIYAADLQQQQQQYPAIYSTEDQQGVSPRSYSNQSPNAQSPQSAYSPQSPGSVDVKDEDDDYEGTGHAGSKGSIKRERQHSSTHIDAKGNKISKPKKEKTSHNMIEKRYRTNINDKILALRDCVPSLRCVVNGTPRTSEELEGLTPASKLNKATVLTKATEYILHLQKRNAILLKELSDLRTHRVDSTASSPNDMASTSVLGGLPPNIMSAYPNLQQDPRQGFNGNGFASKVMMCSMAGLMGAGLMGEGSDTQGLSVLPFTGIFTNFKVGTWDSSSILFGVKLSLILGTVLYVLAPSLFASSSKPEQSKTGFVEETLQQETDESQSLNFELSDIRKQTWLNNSRTLQLPTSSISSQVSAYFRTFAQILTLNVMGAEGYEMLFGSSNDEQLPMKRMALASAIDAQLCGGDDSDTTRSSLIYTLAQSFLLAPSTVRYFTQAMQINVLCHDTPVLDFIGSHFSAYFMNKARAAAALEEKKEQDDQQEDESELAQHITALLESNNVFNPRINQRLLNVAFGHPISEGCPLGDDDEGYASVVTDKSIRSAHDVLAALHANSLLHDVLLGILENDEIDFRKLELSARVSPPRSIVARRVAIAEALLLGPKDASYAKNAMEMLKEELNQQAWINKELSSFNAATSSTAPASFGSAAGGTSDVPSLPSSTSHSRSNSHASHNTINTVTLSAGIVSEIDEEEEESLFSSSESIMSSAEEYVEDQESEGSVSTERGDSVAFLSTSVKSSSIPFAVSQDSRLGIRFSLVMCYLGRNMTGPAFQLLQKVEINKLESIGLLGFVAMWKVLTEMYERKYTSSRHKLEDLSAIARIWLGGNIGSEEGIHLERLRYLVGESVSMSKFFGGFECELDEGYGTQ